MLFQSIYPSEFLLFQLNLSPQGLLDMEMEQIFRNIRQLDTKENTAFSQ